MDISELELIDSIDWARLAMAVDCEGSIIVAKQSDRRHWANNRYYIRVQISNTNYKLIDWLQFFFGFNVIWRTKKQKDYHKQQYIAYIDSNWAARIIQGIKPFLIIKGELADIALEMQSTIGYQGRGQSVHVPSDVVTHREKLRLRAKELNQRGRP